jgi:phage shock protein PspC (stress-responsive transcriptional regulator)
MLKIGIHRSTSNKWIFGVCSGFAEKFALNPMWVRLGVVAAALLPAGLGTIPIGLAYIALAILLPAQETAPFDPSQTNPPTN